ncbi:MAG: hypothetical protein Ct9H300mP21_05030 [Pseudomonadota bacterium]|nr:MAG: hypothetical protein Ct9H300mP21_05030 [Pseudomonadota bacterium]
MSECSSANVFTGKCLSGSLEKVSKGDDLPPGVIRMIKVFIAIKRRLSVGTKWQDVMEQRRCFNLSAVENMPFMEDGSPVDIVLNPLGVPSRMKLGRYLKPSWACTSGLGKKIEEFLEKNNPQSKLGVS